MAYQDRRDHATPRYADHTDPLRVDLGLCAQKTIGFNRRRNRMKHPLIFYRLFGNDTIIVGPCCIFIISKHLISFTRPIIAILRGFCGTGKFCFWHIACHVDGNCRKTAFYPILHPTTIRMTTTAMNQNNRRTIHSIVRHTIVCKYLSLFPLIRFALKQ